MINRAGTFVSNLSGEMAYESFRPAPRHSAISGECLVLGRGLHSCDRRHPQAARCGERRVVYDFALRFLHVALSFLQCQRAVLHRLSSPVALLGFCTAPSSPSQHCPLCMRGMWCSFAYAWRMSKLRLHQRIKKLLTGHRLMPTGYGGCLGEYVPENKNIGLL